ncbi:hypothetical protein ICA16_22720 [Pseudomonas anatoliensis]|uniref:hypothetical protein n=1 Tax=Pseudomonas anatoliensis TaxID=2710589 RepID=UPI001B33E211|nr:hypothetical protein [Pseudomonas anatoliensis]MBP5958490.1 hypothetical protein [Pseudomonas anatoliensis]
MPSENTELGFNLNTPDGGRGYVANLFKTVLKRHDYRQYISERLAGDFACTLAQHLDRITAERHAMQQRLNAADQRIDELTFQQAEAVDLLKYLKDEREYPDDFEQRLKAATQQ